MSKDMSDIVGGLTPQQARETVKAGIKPVDVTQKANEGAPDYRLPPIKNALKLIEEPLALPPVLIEGLLHSGSTMVYGGGSKTNKTFALMDLAVSVAAGVPWWGLKTTQGKVLYIDFELQKSFFRDRLKAIAQSKVVEDSHLEKLDVWNLRGHATDLKELTQELVERIKNGGYQVIILDPVYKVLGDRDENNAGDINSLMNELDKIAVESKAAIIVGHHFSKGNQAAKESIDRISGSGVFGRSPDAIVILTKHEEKDVFTVETTLRNFKSMDPFCVEWNYPLMMRNTSADPMKLKKPGASGPKFTPAQLMEVLGNEEMTTSEWEKAACAKLGMSKRTFADKKKILIDSRQVEFLANTKWKARALSKNTHTKPKFQGEPLQTAGTAIAPSAAIHSAVCATAAAALS